MVNFYLVARVVSVAEVKPGEDARRVGLALERTGATLDADLTLTLPAALAAGVEVGQAVCLDVRAATEQERIGFRLDAERAPKRLIRCG